ncbi:hypothetical protein [Luteococcus japonicus]|uniref:hypothetical protein n=1 Tax=Luteococcus japonicus TaxID=33984 RepID=UPI001180C06F|nr:hypothetical protein [Luteococcus japonicus]
MAAPLGQPRAHRRQRGRRHLGGRRRVPATRPLVLLAKPGSWTPGTRLSVQWLRNGKTIKGATSTRYTAVAADQDKRLQVRVTGRKAGMRPVTRTSASTARVRARVPKVRRASSWHAFASPDERNSSIRLGDRAPATGQQ